MKKLFAPLGFITLIGLLNGCAISRYEVTEGKDGVKHTSLHQYVFIQKAALDNLRVSPKTGFSIKAANTETQEEVIQGITQAAVQGAIKGATGKP